MKLIHGDCLDVLKKLPDNSVDSVVTDPPAGISFMGKSWDDDKGGRKQWIAWLTEVMTECMRVMKPGAHGLVWAIPRTSHWTATALEDAGFEIRDVVTHLFGSGFPKSMAIDKAIDKMNGDERPVVGQRRAHDIRGGKMHAENGQPQINISITSAASAAWQGWGTALKPASEHWILIRKPCSEKTVAANVLKWGTGGLNIDASRIGYDAAENIDFSKVQDGNIYGSAETYGKAKQKHTTPLFKPGGRFPANLVLSCADTCTEDAHDMFECPIALMDEQSVPCPGPWGKDGNGQARGNGSLFKQGGINSQNELRGKEKATGASRFFYCAKASKSDKNAGCEGLPLVKMDSYAEGSKRKLIAQAEDDKHPNLPRHNHHPTVKSTKLMSYLIRMVTPPNGIVLDPFTGSGTTGVAAIKEGFKFIGIEREKEYFEIAKARIASA